MSSSSSNNAAARAAFSSMIAAHPARVSRLCGWDWLTAALDALPAA
jgi:hypothetical protein